MFAGILLVAALSVRAAPALPLSVFGLDATAIERLGFRDLDRGLVELVSGRFYVGKERESKLRSLAGRGLERSKSRQSEAAGREPDALRLPAFSLKVPDGDGAVRLAGWFDGSDSKPGLRAELLTVAGEPAPSSAGSSSLSPSPAQRETRAVRTDASDLVPPPLALGALQSRGTPAQLARLAASRLPGAGASDLATAGTLATWQAVGALVDRYVARGTRLPKPGWEQDAANAYRDGFASAWDKGPVSVTVTDDARLFKDRGTWIGDPVLRRPDGSVELVVNLPWMETIAQDGAFADSRLTRLRHAIASLDGAERTKLVDGALGGRDPQDMTYGLLYRLAGWMQGELLTAGLSDPAALTQGPAAARDGTLERIERHPVYRAIYEGALNAASTITRGLGGGLSHPELWTPASDADVWTLVREANAGSSSAAKAVGERLAADSSKIGYAEYLDLGLEHNRAAARVLAAAVPGACRLSGRLAQQGDADGIRLFSANCLGPGADAFLAEAFRRSISPDEKKGYQECIEDLLNGSRERPWAEMVGRHRAWLDRLAQDDPDGAAALFGAASIPVKPDPIIARVEALGAGRIEQAAQASAARFSAQPQMFLGLLREPATVEPIAAAAGRGGVDPAYLAAAAYQEGYYLYADALSKGDAPPTFTSQGPMGLDSFGDLEPALKRAGYLAADFSGATRGAGTWLNEAGHRFPTVEFKSPEAALEAMAALLRYKRAQFERDAKSLGLDPASLSPADRELWTYVYYNFRDPRSILAKGGFAAARRPVSPEDPLYNAHRVAATADMLRQLGVFH